jgi:hypothetical protein
MRPRLLVPLLLGVFAAVPAFADTVFLKDGRTLEGTVSHRDGKVVVTLKKGMEVLLEPEEVERVVPGESLRDAFEHKRADLVPGDPEPRYVLAQWCKENGLAGEARALLEEVIRLDPDHAQARRDLGYVRDGGQWVLEEELRRRLGFEKVDGRWVPAADARRQKRTSEVRKLLVKIAFDLPRVGPKNVEAHASLEALARDPEPALVAPLVEERLVEHDPEVRRAFVELLGKLRQKSSAPKLVGLVFDDSSGDVVAAAGSAVWATGDIPSRTALVQNLFHKRLEVRNRAADALAAAGDPETVPYLIEALYLRVVKTVEVQPDEQVIMRGSAGEPVLAGRFGEYHAPLLGVSLGAAPGVHVEEEFLCSRHALAALQRITGKNFEFLKSDWYEWWTKEGKAQLLPKPAGAPDKP